MTTARDTGRARTARDRVLVTLTYADGTTETIEGPVTYYDPDTGEAITDPERIARADRQFEEDMKCPS